MGLFDDVKKSFEKAGEELSKTINTESEKASLSLKNNQLKDSINDKYKEIGKKFYEANRELPPEEYSELFKSIEENNKKIEENNKKLEELKSKS